MANKLTKVSITSQSLASGALSHAVTMGSDRSTEDSLELLEVVVKFSSAVSQAASVTRQSGPGGSNYAPVLDSATLSSATSYIYRPNPPAPLKRGDIITVAVANSGTPAVVAYSEIRYRETT